MKKRIISTLIFLLFCLAAKAQFVGEDYDMFQFQRKVKMIGEFMQRFNMTELAPGLSPTDTLLREKSFAALLDYSLVTKNPDGAFEFLNMLVQDTAKLAFTDTNWRAFANCEVILDGKPSKLTLVLRTEHIDGYRYKWTICDAFGDALLLSPQKTNPGLRIDPTDNEINFVALRHITTKEASNILNYKSEEINLHGLSVFLTLVRVGKLKVNQVDEISYKFYCPNYMFTVRKFNHDGYNSGWLISDYQIKTAKQ